MKRVVSALIFLAACTEAKSPPEDPCIVNARACYQLGGSWQECREAYQQCIGRDAGAR